MVDTGTPAIDDAARRQLAIDLFRCRASTACSAAESRHWCTRGCVLDTCVDHSIGDFDIAYAHEAMARAYRLLGDEAESTAHAEQARRASAGIADPEDREHAMEDIAELL
jgi:hypothetical protein